jgi:drug/metabolite transporter (DMT)-like permease
LPVLGETLTISELSGVVLVLTGIYLVNRKA